MNTVNRPIPLELAHKLRSAAQALLADAANQPAPLASALMQEAAAIQCRADALEKDAKQVEPTEFGSIVRAGRGDSVRVLWQPTTFHGRHYWMSEFGIVEVWSELTDVEVLRVGLGGDAISPHAAEIVAAQEAGFRDGIRIGKQDVVAKMHGQLQLHYAEAISAERKNAIGRMITVVDEPDTTTPEVIADWVASHRHPAECAWGCQCEPREEG